MNPGKIRMHLAAGRYYGKDVTCRHKIQFSSEESASRQLEKFAASGEMRHPLEVYPCYFSEGETHWHLGREMTGSERSLFYDKASEILEMEDVVLNVAEPGHGVQTGEQALRVHNRKLCEGRNCCIHNPSDHHMKGWVMNWRDDRRIMERLCPHGIGHPDPDDAAFRRTIGDSNTVHGCDGCCERKMA